MSQKLQSKTGEKLFNIDKEARKCYPNNQPHRNTEPLSVYVARKSQKHQTSYVRMAA